MFMFSVLFYTKQGYPIAHSTLTHTAVHVIFYLLKKLKVCVWWKVNLAYNLANLQELHSNNNNNYY